MKHKLYTLELCIFEVFFYIFIEVLLYYEQGTEQQIKITDDEYSFIFLSDHTLI